jgi:hypothetical protein
MLKHKHHIIPRHMGGTDVPENIIELTVDEHANAHKILYEKHGKWQDFMAWQALSGQIEKEELRRLATKLSLTGIPKTEEHKKKISESKKGKKLSDETKRKMSISQKARKITWDLKSITPESNEKRSKALTGRKKPVIICPHCGKSGGLPTMKQWHFDKCKERK